MTTKKTEREAPAEDASPDLAQRCYERFASQKINDGGLPLPPFSGLHPTDQAAWLAVANMLITGWTQ